MGLQLPPRANAPAKRVATAAVLGLAVLLLGACSAEDTQQLKNFAMPTPATESAWATFDLWRWSWVALMVVGVLVWGLIGFAVVRYRRRSPDEIPVQTRYNLPLEIFYTIAPILMVIVLFSHTVETQNTVLNMDPDPDLTVEVTGQQWSWTFNHGLGATNASPNPEKGQYRYDEYAYTAGTTGQIPTLVLPVDRTVQFNLYSPDVIHSFSVDAFLMKMDVIPGRVNKFQVKPTVIGDYNGRCFELCGTYHSRMLFNAKVVSQADYDEYVKTLATSEKPLLGGNQAYTVDGLNTDPAEGGQE